MIVAFIFSHAYFFFFFQYNKQHIIPLEEVKLESLEDEGRKRHFISFLFCCYYRLRDAK